MNRSKVKQLGVTAFKLMFGLTLYSVGIVIFLKSNFGLTVWDVLNDGISRVTGIGIGVCGSIVSAVLLLVNFIMGVKIGIGNIINVVYTGPLVDIIMRWNIPEATTLPMQILLLIAGMTTITFATYFYVGAGLGIGPREGLIVAIMKKTGKSLRRIKVIVEVSALAAGALLGGRFGIATVVVAVGMGPYTNWVFDKLHFDIKNVQHLYLDDQFRDWMRKRRKKQEGASTQPPK